MVVMMMVLMMVMMMNMMMMMPMVKLWELCYKKATNSNRQLLSPFSLPSVVTRRYHHHHPRRHLLAYLKLIILILKITIADPIKSSKMFERLKLDFKTHL